MTPSQIKKMANNNIPKFPGIFMVPTKPLASALARE